MAEQNPPRRTKRCIACAEEIMFEAVLCKHCRTAQDDPRFTAVEPEERLADSIPNTLTSVHHEISSTTNFGGREFTPERKCEQCDIREAIEGSKICFRCMIENKTKFDAGTPTSTQAVVPGRSNMIIGGLICVVGLIVTFGTYNIAAPGGHFIVAWGAIVFGAIQFFRGVSEWNSHNNR